MSTSCPINLTRDRDGISNEGFATTAADAVRIIQASRDPEWNVKSAYLADRQCSSVNPDRAALARAYADEIAVGWASIDQVYSGWIITASTWITEEVMIDDEYNEHGPAHFIK